MLTLVVGDICDELGVYANTLDSSAYLITATNVYNQHSGTGYVSLGDLNSIKEFIHIISIANKVIYCPPTVWSDRKTEDDYGSMAWFSIKYIAILSSALKIPVENLPLNKLFDLPEPSNRQSESLQLWVAGCSTTYGIGVNHGQRYCDHLVNALGLELNLLATPASSINWAADQILRANIKSNDIVVWGLTDNNRFPWFDNGKLYHAGVNFYTDNPWLDKIGRAHV